MSGYHDMTPEDIANLDEARRLNELAMRAAHRVIRVPHKSKDRSKYNADGTRKLTTYIFYREDGFYFLELSDDQAAIENGKCNPGTTRVANLVTGKIIYGDGAEESQLNPIRCAEGQQ